MENLKLYIIIAVVLVFLSVVIVFFGDEIEKLPHINGGGSKRRLNGLLDLIYILIFAIASLFGIFLVIGNKIIKFLSKDKEEEEEWGEEDENKEEENEEQALDINLDVNFKNSRKIISAILIFIFVILPIIFITICIIEQIFIK